MWLDDYTWPLTDEQQMEKEQVWYDKTEHIAKRLDSNEILERHKSNFELIKPLLKNNISKFLKEKDITNWLMLSIEKYDEFLVRSTKDKSDQDAKEMFEIYNNSLVRTLVRSFTNKDIDITDEEEDELLVNIYAFRNWLKWVLLKKHWINNNEIDTLK